MDVRSRQPSRPKDVVVSVPHCGAGGGLAGAPFINPDVPVLAKELNKIGMAHIVGRVEPVRLGHFRIDVGMVHHEQDSFRSHSCQKRDFGVVIWRATQHRLLCADKIEAAGWKPCVHQPGVHPLHVNCGFSGLQRRAL